VIGVLATRDENNDVVAEVVLEHRADRNADEPSQLREIADHIEGRLRDLAPDVVVIRTIDWFPNSSRETARKKYLVEGAVTVEVRRKINRVEALSGRDIGVRCGSSKAAVEAEAQALVGAGARDAGSAAFAALVIGEG
jgi:hypothetical protein